jgi:hypothetical protein
MDTSCIEKFNINLCDALAREEINKGKLIKNDYTSSDIYKIAILYVN